MNFTVLLKHSAFPYFTSFSIVISDLADRMAVEKMAEIKNRILKKYYFIKMFSNKNSWLGLNFDDVFDF